MLQNAKERLVGYIICRAIRDLDPLGHVGYVGLAAPVVQQLEDDGGGVDTDLEEAAPVHTNVLGARTLLRERLVKNWNVKWVGNIRVPVLAISDLSRYSECTYSKKFIWAE